MKCSQREIFCSIKNTKFVCQIFFNPFVDIALTFLDSSFNSFLFHFCFIFKNTKFIYQIFFNPCVDIALPFFDWSFNSFLFDVTSFSLLSKSVFFAKLAISPLLAKCSCLSPVVKFCAVNLLNSGVVIYLPWSWSLILFLISLIFAL